MDPGKTRLKCFKKNIGNGLATGSILMIACEQAPSEGGKKIGDRKLACVAGGSGSKHETFCGEAANFLAGFARERILHSRSGPTFARVPTPAGYAG